jgi:DNA-directed RNA polymerase beta' subunit
MEQLSKSSAPLRKIISTQFGIMSPAEILANSVASIEWTELYEDKKPKVGSLMDPRMGCVSNTTACYTCLVS